MSAFHQTLSEVRSRIAKYRGSRRVNEENTKATLIEPVLRALGWDIEDLEDVQREFKLKKQDKPVDYALLDLRTPRLFIEAKALNENLEDRKWTSQIMGYATVAGVEWIVLTNGDEYRIYNAHAAVAVDEKLFRSIKISEDTPEAAETLGLLSKERLKENRIEVLWKAHFVDRQVLAVIEELFSGGADASLVRLIRSRTNDLSPKEIRASLTRCQLTAEFPVVTECSAPSSETTRTRKQKGTKPRQKSQTPDAAARREVSLQDLIEAKLIRPPVQLFRKYR